MSQGSKSRLCTTTQTARIRALNVLARRSPSFSIRPCMGYLAMTVNTPLAPPCNFFIRSLACSDSGAMGSFVVFHLAGLYPVPATNQFLLSSPFFPSVSFFNPLFNTKTTIRTKNFSPQAIFVKVRSRPRVVASVLMLTDEFSQSVTVDGQLWKSNCFIEWDVFVRGATVELELTEDPNVTCGELPPSLSTGGFA
jgi:hypothetical protein